MPDDEDVAFVVADGIGGWAFAACTSEAPGEASIERAAEEGRISKVTHVDYAILNVLGIYMEFTVRAFGE